MQARLKRSQFRLSKSRAVSPEKSFGKFKSSKTQKSKSSLSGVAKSAKKKTFFGGDIFRRVICDFLEFDTHINTLHVLKFPGFLFGFFAAPCE